jgi:hypothetical protein
MFSKVIAAGVERGVITPAQASELTTIGKEITDDTSVLSIANAFFYLGGVVAILGISLYVTWGFEQHSGLELAFIAAAIMAASFIGGVALLRKGTMVPAGILGTLAVVATPLLVYGIQKHLGYWPTYGGDGDVGSYRSYHTMVGDQWLIMEIATLVAAVAAISVIRMPFLVMPVSVTLWYLCMDLAQRVVHGQSDGYHPGYFETYRNMSLWFGLVVLAIGFATDLFLHKKERGFAFWLYLSGMATFWGALASMDSTNEVSKLMFCLLNVGFVLLSGVIRQGVFSWFGYVGIAMYMFHISTTIFKEAALFPIACVVTGLVFMVFGWLWKQFEPTVVGSVRRALSLDVEPETMPRSSL